MTALESQPKLGHSPIPLGRDRFMISGCNLIRLADPVASVPSGLSLEPYTSAAALRASLIV